MDRGAWRATVHRVAKSQTRLKQLSTHAGDVDFSKDRSGGLVFPSLEEFSTVLCDPHKGFGIVNKSEIDVFLELSCFIDDPADIANLISGSFAFSKTSYSKVKYLRYGAEGKPSLNRATSCMP